MSGNAEQHEQQRLARLAVARAAEDAGSDRLVTAVREGDAFKAAAGREVFGAMNAAGTSLEARVNSRCVRGGGAGPPGSGGWLGRLRLLSGGVLGVVHGQAMCQVGGSACHCGGMGGVGGGPHTASPQVGLGKCSAQPMAQVVQDVCSCRFRCAPRGAKRCRHVGANAEMIAAPAAPVLCPPFSLNTRHRKHFNARGP